MNISMSLSQEDESKCMKEDLATKSHFDTNMISIQCIKTEKMRCNSIVHTHENDVWISNCADRTITLYDKNLKQKKVVDVDFDFRDITVLPPQDLILTDMTNKTLVRMSPDGWLTVMYSTAPWFPRGVCINDRQELVVGLNAHGGIPPIKLTIYSSDCTSILQEIEKDEISPRGSTR